MKENVAIINKVNNIYYAYWYNNGDTCVESDPDYFCLESKIINKLGITRIIFGYGCWNE